MLIYLTALALTATALAGHQRWLRLPYHDVGSETPLMPIVVFQTPLIPYRISGVSVTADSCSLLKIYADMNLNLNTFKV
jgi:hypothetical protein